MTQKELDFLYRYLVIKANDSKIDMMHVHDIIDLMRVECLNEPLNEDKIEAKAEEYCSKAIEKDSVSLDDDGCVDLFNGFVDGYKAAQSELF